MTKDNEDSLCKKNKKINKNDRADLSEVYDSVSRDEKKVSELERGIK